MTAFTIKLLEYFTSIGVDIFHVFNREINFRFHILLKYLNENDFPLKMEMKKR